MSTKTLSGMATLIHDFRNAPTRERLGPSLALVVPGRWGDFIRWGASHGYTITPQEIRDQIARHPGMITTFARNPWLQGWNHDSLDSFVAGARTAPV